MLTFMGISAFILDTVHTMGGHVFWIIQPFRRPDTAADNSDNNNNNIDNNNNVEEKSHRICLHKNTSCETYIMQALKNYTTIGICLEIVKSLFSNFSLICQSPTVGLIRAAKRINPKFLLFVAGYPTLYRVMKTQYLAPSCIALVTHFLDFRWRTVRWIVTSGNQTDWHMQRLPSSAECRTIFSRTNCRFSHTAFHRRWNWHGHDICVHSINLQNSTDMQRPYHFHASCILWAVHLCTTFVSSIHGSLPNFCSDWSNCWQTRSILWNITFFTSFRNDDIPQVWWCFDESKLVLDTEHYGHKFESNFWIDTKRAPPKWFESAITSLKPQQPKKLQFIRLRSPLEPIKAISGRIRFLTKRTRKWWNNNGKSIH